MVRPLCVTKQTGARRTAGAPVRKKHALIHSMHSIRQSIGGVGNLLFKQAFLIGKMLDGEIPDLYVQSPKYWAKHADIIKNTFAEGMGPRRNLVSLHFRKGDYTNNSFYVDLARTDYYRKAIAQFPEERFLVFCKDNQNETQDITDRYAVEDYLIELGLAGRYELARFANTEIEDLHSMAACKSHIMANSTFSWWGSFLGGGTTICPIAWFTDGVHRIDLLDEWIKL